MTVLAVGIRETRQQRLEELIAEFGSLKSVAERAGMDPNWLSQIRIGASGMGHKTARRLAEGCGKPEGWMDTPPDVHGIPVGFSQKWKRLTPSQRAALIMMADAFLSETSED